ncbi:hypothetical protein WICPIJ_001964 [Wickerhamomyces pijperi]|uniref:J domain-containing protein n=1 Tax=Wickerhamomyces pijperi TaxID=599730 RepID=A0A9P8TQM6_WICPI|nr:hypothetical protein WICPIJ_001964 [Wickerhamomyces pijperi]
MDHYTILGVTSSATAEEIRKCYLKIAKTHHPDKTKDILKNNKFKSALEAYTTLSDPILRVKYDEMLLSQRTASQVRSFTFTKHPNYTNSKKTTTTTSSASFDEFGSIFTKNPNKYANPTATNFKPQPKSKKPHNSSAAAAAAFKAFYDKQKQTEHTRASEKYSTTANESSNINKESPTKEVPLPENWQRQESFQFKHTQNQPHTKPTQEPEIIEISDQEDEEEEQKAEKVEEQEDLESTETPFSPPPPPQQPRKRTPAPEPAPEPVPVPEPNDVPMSNGSASTTSTDSLPKPNPKKVKLAQLPEDEPDLMWQGANQGGPPTMPQSHATPMNVHTSTRKFQRTARPNIPNLSHSEHVQSIDGPESSTFQAFKAALNNLEKSPIFDSSIPRSPKRHKSTNGTDFSMNVNNTNPFSETSGNFQMDDMKTTINEPLPLYEQCILGVDIEMLESTYLDPVIRMVPQCDNVLDQTQWSQFKENYERYLLTLIDLKSELLSTISKRTLRDSQYHFKLLQSPETIQKLNDVDLKILSHLNNVQGLVTNTKLSWCQGVEFRSKFGFKS